jgi:hypothetical protein
MLTRELKPSRGGPSRNANAPAWAEARASGTAAAQVAAVGADEAQNA